MKINHEQLLAASPEEAAGILHQAGGSLRGTNLRKSSWLLIANGLHVHRVSMILLQRLEAATTREDALRVLRIARKWVRTRKAAKSGQARARQESPLVAAQETSQLKYKEDEEMFRYEQWLDADGWPQEDLETWLAEQASADQTTRTRLPGVLPISSLQDAVDRYAWDRRDLNRERPETLRSRLDEKTYQRLLALTACKPGLDLTDIEMTFLRENHLDPLLQYAAGPGQYLPQDSIRDGFTLAGLRMIEDHTAPGRHPFRVDWEAIDQWLRPYLALKPDPEQTPIVIACAYAFFRTAPAAVLTDFLRSLAGWHPAWSSLLGYAFSRAADLFPVQPLLAPEPPDQWGFGGAQVRTVPWERVLDAGTGSRLVLSNLRNNLADLFNNLQQIPDSYRTPACKLLLAGGGSLRRMDYPSFTLVCRPSITLMRLDTLTRLVSLAWQLKNLDYRVTLLSQSSLAAWIASTGAELSPQPLPERLCSEIASLLEKHTAAYLMLKERVLRDTFLAAPFRLRRKHILRFWSGPEAAALPAEALQLQALNREFGPDLLKEGLAHALLDHFKDDWGLTGDAAFQMKETLLTLLRHVALTYHQRTVQLTFEDELTEEDLETGAEVANYLIQQTENAPLELAQALLLEPGQGLPRLAGGRLTELEQSCRRLVKETAGVSQKKLTHDQARVFTCRPLSKVEALDRGKLGGDCSSSSVPLRALSPHHTYYGIFENNRQQRGYITVYEAQARLWDAQETGPSIPVLCLETINVPMRIFDTVLQDLLVILQSVAVSRGLADALVLITGISTWNYQSGEILRQSRRFRQGRPVRLHPADPPGWNVYQLLAPEAASYTAFFDDPTARHNRENFRLLAPFEPALDLIEPENLAEARRIAALPAGRLWLTARDENGPAGFISARPELF